MKIRPYKLNLQLFGNEDIDYGEPEPTEIPDDDEDETDTENDAEEEIVEENAEKSIEKEETAAPQKDVDKEIEEKQKQDKDLNAKYAEERRKREETIKREREEAYAKGIKDAVGGVNPFTGEKIETDDDVEELKVMQEAKKRGLDPLADYHKVSKILKQESREKAIQEEVNETQKKEQAQKDINEFKAQYPDVNLSELLNKEDFKPIAQKYLGKLNLSEVYGLYQDLQSTTEKVKQDTMDKKTARALSSQMSLTNGGGKAPNDSLYTVEQLKRMSPSEIDKNWEKVKKSYDNIK